MEQGHESRREFFRMGLDGHPGTMQIFEIDLNPIAGEPREIRILNLGGGGLYMQTDQDLPVSQGIYATFRFTLQGQEFSFRGELGRKTEGAKLFWYGVTFVDVEEGDRQALISALQKTQIQISRKARPPV